MTALSGAQIKLIDLTIARRPMGWANVRFELFQALIETSRIADSRLDQAFDRVKHPACDNRLKWLQPVVDAPDLNMVAIQKSVVAIQPQECCGFVIIGYNDAAIAPYIQRL